MATKSLRIRNKKDLKWPKVLIAILSTIGIVDTGSITLKTWGLWSSLSCKVGVFNTECDKVLDSEWGTLFQNNQIQIPLSFAGFITYLSLLILSILLTLKLTSSTEKLNKTIWWFVYLISCGSTVFSLLLLYIMIFKIQAICPFCIISAISSLSIFILSIIGARFENREPMIFRGTIVAFLVLISGLIWDNKVDPANAEQISKTAPIEKIAPKVTTKSSSQKINFAKFLSQNNIFMYSAYWCSHCFDQKQLFGQEAVKELSIIECAKDGKDSQTELCIEKEIQGFPSWEINGAIYSGVKNLNELAVMTGYEGDTSF